MIAWRQNAESRSPWAGVVVPDVVAYSPPLEPPAPRVRDYIIIAALPAPEPAPEPLPPTMAHIRSVVAEHYGLERFDMVSARRSRALAYPRQLAMYLCRTLTPRSLPEIGRAFGGRDHSTVIHAIKRVQYRLANNADVRADHDAIIEALGE